MAHHRRPRRGSAAIEFGFWLPVLMMFLSAVVDYGSYMNQRVAVSRAVMEGCRAGAAIFEPDDLEAGSVITPTAVDRTNQVLTDLGITCPAKECVTTSTYCPKGSGGVCKGAPFDALVVETTYEFIAPIGLLPAPSSIREQFIMAAENQRSGGDDD